MITYLQISRFLIEKNDDLYRQPALVTAGGATNWHLACILD